MRRDDREANQENPSLLPNNINKEESPRFKRDEWSEGAVSSLLEAYEAKWTLRNRAKLKGQDWEDVAKFVSARSSSTKSPKTQTQCKNKIESMKKRYRSESAMADASSWPLYPRIDLLLRGNAPPQLPPTPAAAAEPVFTSLEAPQQPQQLQQQPPPPPPPPPPPAMCHGNVAENSHGSIGLDRVGKEDGEEVGNKLCDQESDKNPIETDSSTPNFKMKTKKKRKQRSEECEIAESIRWLAEVIMRSEQARLDTMREIEKMRAEAEAKRGEMDLKRTEILANTQLEIAKLFAGIGKGVDPSLRIGRS